MSVISAPIQEAHLERDLQHALRIVNQELASENRSVENKKGRTLEAKQPILLVLDDSGKKTPIGITHFAHLRENFNNAPFAENARTIDELAQSILKAVSLHDEAKMDPTVLITAAGVPFYSEKDVEVSIDSEGILHIAGKSVTYNEKPLLAEMLKGEEGITFSKMANGDYETKNPLDERKGCGIFFDKDTMAIYRG